MYFYDLRSSMVSVQWIVLKLTVTLMYVCPRSSHKSCPELPYFWGICLRCWTLEQKAISISTFLQLSRKPKSPNSNSIIGYSPLGWTERIIFVILSVAEKIKEAKSPCCSINVKRCKCFFFHGCMFSWFYCEVLQFLMYIRIKFCNIFFPITLAVASFVFRDNIYFAFLGMEIRSWLF